MATITSTSSNKFCGSPIIVGVTSATIANATFHRLRLVVQMPSSNPTMKLEFSTAVGDNEAVTFDIASAFRAFADGITYAATTLNSYPSMSALLTAYDDYLVDGQPSEGTNASTATVSGIYAGSLTDRERLGGYNPARYSRKPSSSPEICFTGFQHLYPAALTSGASVNAPSVSAVTVPSGSADGYNIYGITAPADGYELRFINSLGVHENVFISGLHSEEVSIHTDKYVISRPETLTNFSRGIAVKQNDRERWKLTSPPLDRPWQRWYVHELLMARWAWIGIPPTEGTPNVSTQTFIPVHIIPEETIATLDRSKADILTVPVILEFDINGSPF